MKVINMCKLKRNLCNVFAHADREQCKNIIQIKNGESTVF